MKVLNQVKEDIKKKGIQQNNLAKKMNISEPRLTYYLKNDFKIPFYLFVILVGSVYEDELDIINERLIAFIESTKKSVNFRECLEWSIQQGNVKLFKEALKREPDEDMSHLYAAVLERYQDTITPEDFFFKLQERNMKTKEAVALTSILNLYVMRDLGNYQTLNLYATAAKKKVALLKDGFLKDSYNLRIEELEVVASMKNGETEKAIEKLQANIEKYDELKFPHMVNFMYSLLAEAYVFSDKKMAIHYIKIAIKQYKELPILKYKRRLSALKATHDFIKIYNDDFYDLYLEDEAERLHYLAKTGLKDKAIKLLEEIENKKMSLSEFQLYYKAIATSNKKDIEIAKKSFYKKADFHYIQLFDKKNM